MNQKQPQAEGTCCRQCSFSIWNVNTCKRRGCPCHLPPATGNGWKGNPPPEVLVVMTSVAEAVRKTNAETTVQQSQAGSSSPMGEVVEPWRKELVSLWKDGNGLWSRNAHYEEVCSIVAKTIAAERARISEVLKELYNSDFVNEHDRITWNAALNAVARTHAKK